MQAPINLFFDVTPIGKILNRFSKDLQVLDNSLCFTMGKFISCFYQALAALLVAAIAVRWILVAVFFMMFVGIILFRFSLVGYKECNRVETVTKSPMLSFLSESQAGNTVIRAFRRKEEFSTHNYELINKNTLANLISQGVWTWYSIRMDVLSTIVLTAATSFCVLYRTKTDPVLLSMML
jgi:ABC-type multidrug transport system fused ATPase/permease subunit